MRSKVKYFLLSFLLAFEFVNAEQPQLSYCKEHYGVGFYQQGWEIAGVFQDKIYVFQDKGCRKEPLFKSQKSQLFVYDANNLKQLASEKLLFSKRKGINYEIIEVIVDKQGIYLLILSYSQKSSTWSLFLEELTLLGKQTGNTYLLSKQSFSGKSKIEDVSIACNKSNHQSHVGIYIDFYLSEHDVQHRSYTLDVQNKILHHNDLFEIAKNDFYGLNKSLITEKGNTVAMVFANDLSKSLMSNNSPFQRLFLKVFDAQGVLLNLLSVDLQGKFLTEFEAVISDDQKTINLIGTASNYPRVKGRFHSPFSNSIEYTFFLSVQLFSASPVVVKYDTIPNSLLHAVNRYYAAPEEGLFKLRKRIKRSSTGSLTMVLESCRSKLVEQHKILPDAIIKELIWSHEYGALFVFTYNTKGRLKYCTLIPKKQVVSESETKGSFHLSAKADQVIITYDQSSSMETRNGSWINTFKKKKDSYIIVHQINETGKITESRIEKKLNKRRILVTNIRKERYLESDSSWVFAVKQGFFGNQKCHFLKLRE